ncbi:thymidylate synthase [Lysinibacillus sphaericus]|nr:thymidylate synthase [Lysinibacillus sphaericus]
MSIADVKYKELIEDIYNNGEWDFDGDVRTKYADGSNAYTKSVFGRQIIFNEGEIPLLTTKHVGWKTAFKEMYLFWVKQTVKKDEFEKMDVKVWDEWFLEDGSLGKSYAYQFESRPDKILSKVKKIKKERHSNNLPQIIVDTIKSPNINPTINAKYVGNIYSTRDYGNYIVLDSYINNVNPNPRFLIQFLETGYTKEVDAASIIRQANIVDNYHRFYFGVGYLGKKEKFKGILENDLLVKLYRKWYYMLARCYDKENRLYSIYGAKGVFVCERWHSLEHYIEDVIKVPNFFIAKQYDFKDYDLDKDYYESNCYSLETCVWLNGGENLVYRNKPKAINLIHPNGDKEKFISIGDAEKKYNITNLNKVLSGSRRHVRGYIAEFVEDLDDDEVYRYKLSNNQVIDLIHNIKNNPKSRRLMTSFWNDADVKEKALQECAMQTTWSVRGNKLDLLLYSRSVDTALGLPYNWIQYWFLLQIMAKSTGLGAGKFIHQMGNVHYYCRHEKTLLEQIESKKHEQPLFSIRDKKDFFQFTLSDISIENYNHNGKFEYEVAI